jgi:hypothetical protein
MFKQAVHTAFIVLYRIKLGYWKHTKWWKHETSNIKAPVTVKDEGVWGYCQQTASLVSNLPANWNISVKHLNPLWQAKGSLTLQWKNSQQFVCLSTFPYSVPIYCCVVISTSASYSEGSGFKTQPVYKLFWAFLWFSLDPPCKCQHSTAKQAMATSFHILSNSLVTFLLPFDRIQSEVPSVMNFQWQGGYLNFSTCFI